MADWRAHGDGTSVGRQKPLCERCAARERACVVASQRSATRNATDLTDAASTRRRRCRRCRRWTGDGSARRCTRCIHHDYTGAGVGWDVQVCATRRTASVVYKSSDDGAGGGGGGTQQPYYYLSVTSRPSAAAAVVIFYISTHTRVALLKNVIKYIILHFNDIVMRSEFDNDPSSVEYNTRRWYNIISIDGDVGVVIITYGPRTSKIRYNTNPSIEY